MSTRNGTTKTPPVKRIKVTNIRGVKHVELGKVEQHLVVIGGMNKAGKTSFATAIRAAAGGMRGIESLLRDGAQIGAVVIDLGDRKIVRVVKRRKDNTEATTLEVIGVDGQPEQKPQERMDRLVRPLSFNPMTFFDSHPNEQVRIFLAARGVDYRELDERIADLEQERLIVGRERDKCKGALAKYPPTWNPPLEPLDVKELGEQLAAAHKANAANEERRRQVAGREDYVKGLQNLYQSAKQEHERLCVEEGRLVAEIERLQRGLEETRRRIVQAQEEIVARRAEGKAFVEETETLKAALENLEDVDTAEIERMMADVDAHNEEYQRGLRRQEWAKQLEHFSASWDSFTGEINEIHAEKRKMLADALVGFPVQGLEIGERGLMMDGRSVNLLNSAEQLKLALAIAYAQVDEDFPIVILDQAERLDPVQLDMVRQMTEEAGVLTLALRVATDGTCNIVLEDGQVMGAEQWADEVLNGPLEVAA